MDIRRSSLKTYLFSNQNWRERKIRLEHGKNIIKNTRRGKKPFSSGFGRFDNLEPDGGDASKATKIG